MNDVTFLLQVFPKALAPEEVVFFIVSFGSVLQYIKFKLKIFIC